MLDVIMNDILGTPAILVGLFAFVPSIDVYTSSHRVKSDCTWACASFLHGCGCGVFGNATGGRRGAIVGAFSNGLTISFILAILLIFMGDIGYEGTTFGDSDFSIVGIIIINILKLFGAI